MNFKEWTESKQEYKIFIDLDNTLVDQDKDGEICERPNAKQFIKALQSLASVCILTHGITEQQKQVAQKFGLSLPVIGRDKFNTVKAVNPILIDNESVHSSYTRSKLQALKIDSSRLIKVKAWHCGNETDNELMSLLPKVKELLVQHADSDKPKSHHKF